MVKDEERGEEVAGWGCDIKGGRLANGMTADGWLATGKEKNK